MKIPDDFVTQVTTALSEWVRSMNPTEAHEPNMFFSGVPYSPAQLVKEVYTKTQFGLDYVEILFEMDRRMRAVKTNGSVIELIRRSIRKSTLSTKQSYDISSVATHRS